MSQKVCELVFYSSRMSVRVEAGRHQFPCEMIRICICMKIPPAGLSARPPPHSFVLDGNDTLVGWSDEIQFDHKFFEAETWPTSQSRRDYMLLLAFALTTILTPGQYPESHQ